MQLPDRPDPDQLRNQAKELKRDLASGRADAIQRVLEFHPKFAGRPAERVEGWTFTLRDAQVTIAREYGFESWAVLMRQVEGQQVTRWGVARWSDAVARAMTLAHELGHKAVMGEHVLLALLSPKQPTVAAVVMSELGMDYDEILDRLGTMDIGFDHESEGTRSTPVFHQLAGFAQGLALGMGSDTVTDEHVLLAIAYADPTGDQRLITYEIDPDEVVNGLRARGVHVPRLAPPVLAPPSGPWGPTVYYLPEDSPAVHEQLIDRYPPGTARWGTNTSTWKEGYIYVDGEDEIPMEEIVRAAVKDSSTVEVVPFLEAIERESQGRRKT